MYFSRQNDWWDRIYFQGSGICSRTATFSESATARLNAKKIHDQPATNQIGMTLVAASEIDAISKIDPINESVRLVSIG